MAIMPAFKIGDTVLIKKPKDIQPGGYLGCDGGPFWLSYMDHFDNAVRVISDIPPYRFGTSSIYSGTVYRILGDSGSFNFDERWLTLQSTTTSQTPCDCPVSQILLRGCKNPKHI